MGARDLDTIMVVEDEEDIRKIINVALGTVGGFSVEMCASAHEALNVLNDRQPDLILLDVMMPLMDGPAFLTEFRRQSRHNNIPVIFITAKVQAHEVEAYKALGVLGVIAKPFDPLTLPEQVKTLWQSHITINS
mgnify:CR=1 FL=1